MEAPSAESESWSISLYPFYEPHVSRQADAAPGRAHLPVRPPSPSTPREMPCPVIWPAPPAQPPPLMMRASSDVRSKVDS